MQFQSAKYTSLHRCKVTQLLQPLTNFHSISSIAESSCITNNDDIEMMILQQRVKILQDENLFEFTYVILPILLYLQYEKKKLLLINWKVTYMTFGVRSYEDIFVQKIRSRKDFDGTLITSHYVFDSMFRVAEMYADIKYLPTTFIGKIFISTSNIRCRTAALLKLVHVETSFDEKRFIEACLFLLFVQHILREDEDPRIPTLAAHVFQRLWASISLYRLVVSYTEIISACQILNHKNNRVYDNFTYILHEKIINDLSMITTASMRAMRRMFHSVSLLHYRTWNLLFPLSFFVNRKIIKYTMRLLSYRLRVEFYAKMANCEKRKILDILDIICAFRNLTSFRGIYMIEMRLASSIHTEQTNSPSHLLISNLSKSACRIVQQNVSTDTMHNRYANLYRTEYNIVVNEGVKFDTYDVRLTIDPFWHNPEYYENIEWLDYIFGSANIMTTTMSKSQSCNTTSCIDDDKDDTHEMKRRSVLISQNINGFLVSIFKPQSSNFANAIAPCDKTLSSYLLSMNNDDATFVYTRWRDYGTEHRYLCFAKYVEKITHLIRSALTL